MKGRPVRSRLYSIRLSRAFFVALLKTIGAVYEKKQHCYSRPVL